MQNNDFADVTCWVFDLDNTLYPPEIRLFDQIERRMTRWVMTELGVAEAEASSLRHLYWQRYGTTLAGLMREHGIDPLPYLDYVHDIDFSGIPADLRLADDLQRLPGRKIVYTNACEPYAHQVLRARGFAGVFDQVYGVEHAAFLPKPEAAAFRKIFALDGLDPTRAVMFEDDPRNLVAPHEFGMKTVLVGPNPIMGPHIHHQTNDLSLFLHRLNKDAFGGGL